jgi:hypothetical protein
MGDLAAYDGRAHTLSTTCHRGPGGNGVGLVRPFPVALPVFPYADGSGDCGDYDTPASPSISRNQSTPHPG